MIVVAASVTYFVSMVSVCGSWAEGMLAVGDGYEVVGVCCVSEDG